MNMAVDLDVKTPTKQTYKRILQEPKRYELVHHGYNKEEVWLKN